MSSPVAKKSKKKAPPPTAAAAAKAVSASKAPAPTALFDAIKARQNNPTAGLKKTETVDKSAIAGSAAATPGSKPAAAPANPMMAEMMAMKAKMAQRQQKQSESSSGTSSSPPAPAKPAAAKKPAAQPVPSRGASAGPPVNKPPPVPAPSPAARSRHNSATTAPTREAPQPPSAKQTSKPPLVPKLPLNNAETTKPDPPPAYDEVVANVVKRVRSAGSLGPSRQPRPFTENPRRVTTPAQRDWLEMTDGAMVLLTGFSREKNSMTKQYRMAVSPDHTEISWGNPKEKKKFGKYVLSMSKIIGVHAGPPRDAHGNYLRRFAVDVPFNPMLTLTVHTESGAVPASGKEKNPPALLIITFESTPVLTMWYLACSAAIRYPQGVVPPHSKGTLAFQRLHVAFDVLGVFQSRSRGDLMLSKVVDAIFFSHLESTAARYRILRPALDRHRARFHVHQLAENDSLKVTVVQNLGSANKGTSFAFAPGLRSILIGGAMYGKTEIPLTTITDMYYGYATDVNNSYATPSMPAGMADGFASHLCITIHYSLQKPQVMVVCCPSFEVLQSVYLSLQFVLEPFMPAKPKGKHASRAKLLLRRLGMLMETRCARSGRAMADLVRDACITTLIQSGGSLHVAFQTRAKIQRKYNYYRPAVTTIRKLKQLHGDSVWDSKSPGEKIDLIKEGQRQHITWRPEGGGRSNSVLSPMMRLAYEQMTMSKYLEPMKLGANMDSIIFTQAGKGKKLTRIILGHDEKYISYGNVAEGQFKQKEMGNKLYFEDIIMIKYGMPLQGITRVKTLKGHDHLVCSTSQMFPHWSRRSRAQEALRRARIRHMPDISGTPDQLVKLEELKKKSTTERQFLEASRETQSEMETLARNEMEMVRSEQDGLVAPKQEQYTVKMNEIERTKASLQQNDDDEEELAKVQAKLDALEIDRKSIAEELKVLQNTATETKAAANVKFEEMKVDFSKPVQIAVQAKQAANAEEENWASLIQRDIGILLKEEADLEDDLHEASKDLKRLLGPLQAGDLYVRESCRRDKMNVDARLCCFTIWGMAKGGNVGLTLFPPNRGALMMWLLGLQHLAYPHYRRSGYGDFVTMHAQSRMDSFPLTPGAERHKQLKDAITTTALQGGFTHGNDDGAKSSSRQGFNTERGGGGLAGKEEIVEVSTVGGDLKGAMNAEDIRYPLFFPQALAMDAYGNTIVANTMSVRFPLLTLPAVQSMAASTSNGSLSSIGGTQPLYYDDSTPEMADFSTVQGICCDSRTGDIIVADTAHDRVVQISAKGAIVELMSAATSPALFARRPWGVALESSQNQSAVLVSSRQDHVILRVERTGHHAVTLVAGQMRRAGFKDGKESEALFSEPCGIAVHNKTGEIFVADYSNNVIRRIKNSGPAKGTVSLCAGYTQEISASAGHRNGHSKHAMFNHPQDVAVDPRYNRLVVADCDNHAIREIDLTENRVSTLAGTGLRGYCDGLEGKHRQVAFNSPTGIAVDKLGNILVADTNNNKIRKIVRRWTDVIREGYLEKLAPRRKIWELRYFKLVPGFLSYFNSSTDAESSEDRKASVPLGDFMLDKADHVLQQPFTIELKPVVESEQKRSYSMAANSQTEFDYWWHALSRFTYRVNEEWDKEGFVDLVELKAGQTYTPKLKGNKRWCRIGRVDEIASAFSICVSKENASATMQATLPLSVFTVVSCSSAEHPFAFSLNLFDEHNVEGTEHSRVYVLRCRSDGDQASWEGAFESVKVKLLMEKLSHAPDELKTVTKKEESQGRSKHSGSKVEMFGSGKAGSGPGRSAPSITTHRGSVASLEETVAPTVDATQQVLGSPPGADVLDQFQFPDDASLPAPPNFTGHLRIYPSGHVFKGPPTVLSTSERRLHSGLLRKQPEKGTFGQAKTRYFVLTTERIDYFEAEGIDGNGKGSPKGSITFQGRFELRDVKATKSDPYAFELSQIGGRTYALSSDSEMTKKDWWNHLFRFTIHCHDLARLPQSRSNAGSIPGSGHVVAVLKKATLRARKPALSTVKADVTCEGERVEVTFKKQEDQDWTADGTQLTAYIGEQSFETSTIEISFYGNGTILIGSAVMSMAKLRSGQPSNEIYEVKDRDGKPQGTVVCYLTA